MPALIELGVQTLPEEAEAVTAVVVGLVRPGVGQWRRNMHEAEPPDLSLVVGVPCADLVDVGDADAGLFLELAQRGSGGRLTGIDRAFHDLQAGVWMFEGEYFRCCV